MKRKPKPPIIRLQNGINYTSTSNIYTSVYGIPVSPLNAVKIDIQKS